MDVLPDFLQVRLVLLDFAGGDGGEVEFTLHHEEGRDGRGGEREYGEERSALGSRAG